MLQKTEKAGGQSLMEVIVVLGVTVVVVVALVIVVLTSLKNAKFAQNQSKATKFAQEAMEQIKAIRDRNEADMVFFNSESYKFSGLWGINMSPLCQEVGDELGLCYFKLESPPVLVQGAKGEKQDVEDGLSRQIIISDISDGENFKKEKNITVKVMWKDSSGEHESNLQTKLTNY